MRASTAEVPVFRSLALVATLTAIGCTEYDTFTDTREESVVEIFEVAGADTDIVFFTDNSSSMQRDLIELGGSFEKFLRRLNSANPSWQVITVTGDDGCSTSGVLTPTTPDVLHKFAMGVQTAPDDQSSDEWGLYIAREAVVNAALGLCNDDFLRPEASLHVVFMSDEGDTSPGWEGAHDYWQSYLERIQDIKGDPAKVRVSAIVGPRTGGCSEAQPGLGYIDAAEATGGEVLSICDDWSDDIEILADASILQDTFALQHEPFVETISVRVNSEDRLEGWAYDVAANSIVFTADIPTGRDEVVVSYRALVEFETTEDPNE